jgi:hypothetical protein
MTDGNSKRRRKRLSAALTRTVALGVGNVVETEILGTKDVAVLRQILSGVIEPAVEIDRRRALGALARSDRSTETGQLLGRVLLDRTAPRRERAAAAAYLGLLGPEAGEPPLLAALGKSDGLLRSEVIQSLGQVGTRRGLARLRRLKLGDGDSARRSLALSELAIAFREGRGTGGELADKLAIDWTTIEAAPIDSKAVRATLAALAGPTYGIPLRRDFALGFVCQKLRNVVLLNEALRPGSFPEDAARSGMIAALIVSQPEARIDYYTVRWLLLTSPTADGVAMAMVRPTGELSFEGQALADSSGLRFRLRDVGIERVPAEIVGEVTPDAVKWTMRLWRGPVRDKQRPRSVQPHTIA